MAKILIGNLRAFLHRVIALLHGEFAMTDLGSLNYFLGISAQRSSACSFLSQSTYVEEILKRANMQILAGALQYLTFTRPGISYTVQQVTLSRFSVEAEYRGVANVVANITWVRNLLRELYAPLFTAILVYCDNASGQSAIALSCNTVQHSTTKNIAVRYHYIREQVENEVVEIYFVKTDYQLADIFTKALARERFEFLINCLRMQSITLEQLKRLAESDEE
ncbi:ribonuclease H-like domain-containing protein [Tanacetum coccineum]